MIFVQAELSVWNVCLHSLSVWKYQEWASVHVASINLGTILRNYAFAAFQRRSDVQFHINIWILEYFTTSNSSSTAINHPIQPTPTILGMCLPFFYSHLFEVQAQVIDVYFPVSTGWSPNDCTIANDQNCTSDTLAYLPTPTRRHYNLYENILMT